MSATRRTALAMAGAGLATALTSLAAPAAPPSSVRSLAEAFLNAATAALEKQNDVDALRLRLSAAFDAWKPATPRTFDQQMTLDAGTELFTVEQARACFEHERAKMERYRAVARETDLHGFAQERHLDRRLAILASYEAEAIAELETREAARKPYLDAWEAVQPLHERAWKYRDALLDAPCLTPADAGIKIMALLKATALTDFDEGDAERFAESLANLEA